MVQMVLVAVAFLGLDVLTGVSKSLLNGTFNLQKLPQFMSTSVDWQWVLVALTTGVAQVALSNNDFTSKGLAAAFVVELGTVTVKLAQDIVQKWSGTAPVTAELAS